MLVTQGYLVREKLLRGVLKAAQLASMTYGPGGGTVFLNRHAGVVVTKDGVTSLQELSFSDPLENMGCAVLKQACSTVSKEVGDGTSTTAILSASLLQEAHKAVTAGACPQSLSRELHRISSKAVCLLEEISRPVLTEEDIYRLAMITSNGDQELSEILCDAVMKVGEQGVISVEDGIKVGVELEMPLGFQIQVNFPHYQMQPSRETRINQPLVAISQGRLNSFEDVKEIIETASQWPHPLLILAPSVSEEVVQTWSQNKDEIDLHIWTPQRFHESLQQDLGALTGATILNEIHTPQEFKGEWLGSLQTVTAKYSGQCTLVAYEDSQERIRKRVREIQKELETSSHSHDHDRMRERIASLDGGMCILKVSGRTEAETKERRARIEDCLGSIRCAVSSGVLPGANTALVFVSDWIKAEEEDSPGVRCFVNALQKPFQILAKNLELEAMLILDMIREGRERFDYDPWVGFDFQRNEIRLLDEEPQIFDATQVITEAIHAANSVAATLLLTEAAVFGG